MREILSIASGVLMVVGIIPYIISIIRGPTKPSKATWLIWAVLDVITFVGMYKSHALNWQIPVMVCLSTTIFLLSLKYGVAGWKRIDAVCLAGAAAGITLWWFTQEPVLAIIIAQATVLIGSWPTFVSVREDPSREPKVPWIIGVVSSVCVILAMPAWTFADATQPLVTLFVNAMVVILTCLPPRPQV